MDIQLSPGSFQFLQNQVAAGAYPTTTAALDAAVEMLRRRAALREKLQRSLDQFDRGEYREFDDDSLDDWFRSIFGADCLEKQAE